MSLEMKMVTIKIDGRVYEVEEGRNLLHTALSLGLDIPYFCWHPAMGSVGACRLCAVKQFKDEEDKKGQIVMSCMTGVADGQVFSIEDPEAREFRRSVTEWLMVNHPHDCPVCDEGGECHLQDMTLMTGQCYREYRFTKRTFPNQYLGPFINHEMNRCIQCYRCIRFYRDLAGGGDLQVFGAHDHVYFGRRTDGVLEREFSGNLVEICPTGVFTDKTLKRHFTRKWDLQTAPSICVHCGVGCNTIPGERYGTLRRIRNRFNSKVNGYFLCDRGRFGYEFVNGDDRIRKPRWRVPGGTESQTLDQSSVYQKLSEYLSGATSLIGIGSPRASLEANFALRQLVGADNFHLGVSDSEYALLQETVKLLRQGPAHAASVQEVEQADAVLVLGEDLTNTAPRLDLALHLSVLRKPIREISRPRKIPDWHDAAVREVIQQAKGPLHLAVPCATKLDAIATGTYKAGPDDIARLGYAIAEALGSGVEVSRLSRDLRQRAEEIARALDQAENPVVISGLSLGNLHILHAAWNVAAALSKPERPAGLGLVVPECNSMGMAMMGGNPGRFALERLEKAGGTLLILENDLFQRFDADLVERALEKAERVILVDHTESRTSGLAHVVLPAGTFAESDGTFVSFEGRAQRFYQVFDRDPNLPESWRSLVALQSVVHSEGPNPKSLDEIDAAIEAEIPAFAGIGSLAPPAGFRIAGQRLPRQSHRYSGRTAMHANEDVHEPRPPWDPDSPLSFSMEGYEGTPPSPLIREYWSPGWNSVQSLNKFQEEVGGPLRGGDPGLRLIAPESNEPVQFYRDIPSRFEARQGAWLAVPLYHIHGSERFSTMSPGVSEVAAKPYVGVSSGDAVKLGLADSDTVEVEIGGKGRELPVRILSSLPVGLVGVPVLEGLRIEPGTWVVIRRKGESG